MLLLRYLGPKNYGIWNLVQSSFVVASFVFMFFPTFYRPMERFLPEYFKKGRTKLALYLLIISHIYQFILNFALFLLIQFYFAYKFENMYNIEGFAILLKIWSYWVLFDCFSSSGWTFVINATQKFEIQAILNVVNILKDIFIVGLSYSLKFSLKTFIFLFMIGKVFIIMMFFIVALIIFPKIEGEVSKNEVIYELKRMIKYLIPLKISDLFELVPLNFAKTLVGKYFGAEDTGYFSAVINIISRAYGIIHVSHTISFPRLVKFKVGDIGKFWLFLRKYIEFSLIFGLFSAILGIIFSKEILYIFGGGRFKEVYHLMMVGCFILLPWSFVLPYRTLVYVEEKTWITMLVTFTEICVQILFYFIFIKFHKLWGMIFSIFLSSLWGIFFLLIFLWKLKLLNFTWFRDVYLRFVFSVFYVFFIYFLSKKFDFLFYRVLFFSISLVLIFYFSRDLINFLKRMEV